MRTYTLYLKQIFIVGDRLKKKNLTSCENRLQRDLEVIEVNTNLEPQSGIFTTALLPQPAGLGSLSCLRKPLNVPQLVF